MSFVAPALQQLRSLLVRPMLCLFGKCVADNVYMFNTIGWQGLVAMWRGTNPKSTEVHRLWHLASHFFNHYRSLGVPVKMATAPWLPRHIKAAAAQEPHPFAKVHQEFLTAEMVDM